MELNEKEWKSINDRGKDLESGINRNWDEGHYGMTVDKMMNIDFKEFPSEHILAAAILTDISEQNKLTLNQLEDIDLDQETFNKIRKTQAEYRTKVRNKLLDIIKIEEDDMEKFRLSEDSGCDNEEDFLTQISTAYKIQKRIYFMRNGKDLGDYSRSEKQNEEFSEAAQTYVDANSVLAMDFFDDVFRDEFDDNEEIEEYEVPTGIGTFTVSGKKAETEDYSDDDIEEIKEAEGWLLVKAIKRGNYEAIEANKGEIELNEEMIETLNALKMRATKEGDSEKIEYINKILNSNNKH